jgi:hypothetical protein
MSPHCPSLLDYYQFLLTRSVSADFQDAGRRKTLCVADRQIFHPTFLTPRFRGVSNLILSNIVRE